MLAKKCDPDIRLRTSDINVKEEVSALIKQNNFSLVFDHVFIKAIPSCNFEANGSISSYKNMIAMF